MLLVAAMAPAGPAAAAHKPCRYPDREHVVVRSRAAIVTSDGKRWYGCLRSADRRRLLVRTSDDPDLRVDASNFVLAGRFVAFATTNSDHYQTYWIRVDSVNLKTGRTGVTGDAGTARPQFSGDTLELERLAVSSHGWVAWRTRHEGLFGAEPQEQRVELVDGRGQRLLDSGPIGSLLGPRFTKPGAVVWTKDGTRHSARARSAG